MNNQTLSANACQCRDCPGAACTCGCQASAAAPVAAGCQCGCQSGHPCKCGSGCA